MARLGIFQKNTFVIASVAMGAALLCGGAANAQTEFDPGECARIQNVDVPFEVAAEDDSLSFTGGLNITVSDSELVVGSVSFNNPGLASNLHKDLRSFLSRAAAMAPVASGFDSDWEAIAERLSAGEAPDDVTKEFLTAITNMCEAILALDASQSAVSAAFPAFIAPVEISLSE